MRNQRKKNNRKENPVQGVAQPGSDLLRHVEIMDTEMSYCQSPGENVSPVPELFRVVGPLGLYAERF